MSNDGRTLHLVLKRKWFEMIQSGEKTEEYREIKHHWIHRLCFFKKQEGCTFSSKPNECALCAMSNDFVCHPYEYACFHLGYTNNTMTFKVRDILIGKGKPEWGAPKENVFIIKLGERV